MSVEVKTFSVRCSFAGSEVFTGEVSVVPAFHVAEYAALAHCINETVVGQTAYHYSDIASNVCGEWKLVIAKLVLEFNRQLLIKVRQNENVGDFSDVFWSMFEVDVVFLK